MSHDGKTVISHSTVQTLRAITAATALSDGYDMGVINGVSMILSKKYTSSTISYLVSIMPLFVGIGALSGALLADKFGRKSVLIGSYGLLILGAILMGIPAELWLLFVGRAIVGAGIGVGGIVGIVYMAEIAPTKNRGSIVGQEALFLSCGLLLGYLSNYAFIEFENNYHIMLGLGAVLPSLCLIALLTVGKHLPESPHWTRMLNSPDVSAVTSEAEETSRLVDTNSTTPPRKPRKESIWKLLGEFFSSPGSASAILVGFLQPLSGIGPILYFSDLTFSRVAAKDSQPHITESSIWIGVTKVGILLVSTFLLIDRIGRRTLLLCSSALITLSMGFIAVVLFKHNTRTDLLLLGFCLAVGSFGIGWNIIPTVYPAEVLPTKLRTFGLSFITVAGRSVSIGNAFLYPFIGVQHASVWFLTYAVINGVGFFLVFFLIKETLNKPLIHKLRKKTKGDLESDREEIVHHTDGEDQPTVKADEQEKKLI